MQAACPSLRQNALPHASRARPTALRAALTRTPVRQAGKKTVVQGMAVKGQAKRQASAGNAELGSAPPRACCGTAGAAYRALLRARVCRAWPPAAGRRACSIRRAGAPCLRRLRRLAPTLADCAARPAQAVLAKKRGMSDGAVAMAVDRARKAGGQSLKKMAKCVSRCFCALRRQAKRAPCHALTWRDAQGGRAHRAQGWQARRAAERQEEGWPEANGERAVCAGRRPQVRGRHAQGVHRQHQRCRQGT